MRKRSDNFILYKNTLMLYIMTGTKFILPVIVTACLTRRLGESSYGIVTYVTIVMSYFLMFFDFGFNFSATKKISQNREDYKVIQNTISNVISAKVFLFIVGVIILTIMIPFINVLKENLLFTYTFFLSTAVNIFLPDFVYRGLERMEYVTVRYVLSKVISTTLIFIFVHSSEQLILIPLFYTVGTIVAVIYTLSHMKKKWNYSIRAAHLNEVMSSLKESSIYFFSTFASIGLGAFNTLLMGFMNFPTEQIAYWGVACQVIQGIQAMYDPITSSMFPHVAIKKNYLYVIRITKLLTGAVCVGCILLYFLSGTAIKVLSGPGYEDATVLLKIMIPVLIFSFPAQMIGFPLLGAMGYQKQVTFSTVISASVEIGLSIILVLIGSYTIIFIAVLRNVSEIFLFGIRMCLVVKMVTHLKKNKLHSKDIGGE